MLACRYLKLVQILTVKFQLILLFKFKNFRYKMTVKIKKRVPDFMLFLILIL